MGRVTVRGLPGGAGARARSTQRLLQCRGGRMSPWLVLARHGSPTPPRPPSREGGHPPQYEAWTGRLFAGAAAQAARRWASHSINVCSRGGRGSRHARWVPVMRGGPGGDTRNSISRLTCGTPPQRTRHPEQTCIRKHKQAPISGQLDVAGSVSWRLPLRSGALGAQGGERVQTE